MPIPTEGLGEKRYRAALDKSQPGMVAAQKLAADIIKADEKARKKFEIKNYKLDDSISGTNPVDGTNMDLFHPADFRVEAAKIATTAVKLDEVLTPRDGAIYAAHSRAISTPEQNAEIDAAIAKVNAQVAVDSEFEAEFAALEAQEAEAAKKPIEIADPYNAAPTHARTTIVDGQKVIDMGSVKITATPKGMTIERPRGLVIEDAPPERFVPPLSAKTLAEMAAGREALARHKARKPPVAPEEPQPTKVGPFPDAKEYSPMHVPARSKDGR